MASWIPSKGDLFYVECKPVEETVEGPGGVTVTLRKQDRMYRGLVFRAIEQDEYALIAKNTQGYAKDVTYTFVKKDVTFMPVGPNVARALGIEP